MEKDTDKVFSKQNEHIQSQVVGRNEENAKKLARLMLKHPLLVCGFFLYFAKGRFLS